MKKAFLFIVHCSLFIVFVTPVFAQENAIESGRSTGQKSKVDEIKEKIASTVAQLNLVSKKAFVGEITKLERMQITIEKNSEARIIDVDELTKYVAVGVDKKRSEIAFDDLDVDDDVVAIGLFNKESRKLLARIILVKNIPMNINGVVREVDIKDGTIKIEDKKRGKTFTVDIERTTVIRVYSGAQGLVKSGLSKIEIGQRAHINGVRNEEEDDRITATRILILPGKAVGITQLKEATPSTNSGQASSAIPTKKPTPTQVP